MEEKQVIADLQQYLSHHPIQKTADPQTLLQTALTAYQNARTDGLCHQGAWDIALQKLPTQTYLSENYTIAE